MKKLLSIILAILAVASIFIVSYAESETEEIDITVLSDTELLALKSKVDTELDIRNKNGIIVPEGDLYCPADIDAGSYKVTLIKDASFASVAIQNADNTTADIGFPEEGGSYQFTIEEGQHIQLIGEYLIQKPERISF